MELRLVRESFTDQVTLGSLFVDDQFECFILEDKDRSLRQDMPLSEILAHKVPKQTCIPYGRYEIVVNFSNRFGKKLPLLQGVPGYEGIRIHPGNTPADTEGCLLPGIHKETDSVSLSRDAFAALFAKIQAAMESEKVFITIAKA